MRSFRKLFLIVAALLLVQALGAPMARAQNSPNLNIAPLNTLQANYTSWPFGFLILQQQRNLDVLTFDAAAVSVVVAAAGRASAGAITIAGAVVGEPVIVFGAPTAGGALLVPTAGQFESKVSVAGQVQQLTATNLSANTYIFELIP